MRGGDDITCVGPFNDFDSTNKLVELLILADAFDEKIKSLAFSSKILASLYLVASLLTPQLLIAVL